MYYEVHVTIEPVFDEELYRITMLAKNYRFKVADLLMQKSVNSPAKPSTLDTFMTAHAKTYDEAYELMENLSENLEVKILRKKIEHVVYDTRSTRTRSL